MSTSLATSRFSVWPMPGWLAAVLMMVVVAGVGGEPGDLPAAGPGEHDGRQDHRPDTADRELDAQASTDC